MTDTLHIGLPYLDAAQAQKHVTHNDALQILDALVQLSVLARDINTPPLSPAEGARYIVGLSPTGVFLNHSAAIATFVDGVWRFLPPHAGWFAYVEADNALRLFDGLQWRDASDAIHALANLDRLGIGTTADTQNPFSAKLNAALFTAKSAGEGGTGDLRFKLNKTSSVNVVSQLYQNNYSGRAETGLIGDDHFRVKVSADGSAWKDAVDIDPTSGIVSFPSGAGFGSLPGFRNRLINAGFTINQRGYVSGAALVAAAYGHDRWRAGVGGAAYTFAQTSPDTLITIATGTLQQIVEGSNIEGGSFVLSWSGSAHARINGGAYSSSPVIVNGLAAGSNVTLEFNAGALGKVQFEPGAFATSFERRQITLENVLCQRYFQSYISSVLGTLQLTAYAGSANTFVSIIFPYATPMRTAPTATILGTWLGSNVIGQPYAVPDKTQMFLFVTSAAAGVVQSYAPINGGFSLEAEI